jgi:magnesium-transporting ATPase (P-type)
MKTPRDRREFVEKLLSRDPPPPEQLQHHRDRLFGKIRRRIVLYKGIAGAIYILLFALAFWTFERQRQTDNVTHSILWGSVSIYILLWFLVWFLRGIYRGLAQLVHKDAVSSQKWRRQDRWITIVAIVVLAFSSLLLYRSFSLTDPLRAAHQATACFWGVVFFIFWYPFGTASLVARIWLEHKKMELQLRASESHDSDNQTRRPSNLGGPPAGAPQQDQ